MGPMFAQNMYQCWGMGEGSSAIIGFENRFFAASKERDARGAIARFRGELALRIKDVLALEMDITQDEEDECDCSIALFRPRDAALYRELTRRLAAIWPWWGWVPFTGIMRRCREERHLSLQIYELVQVSVWTESEYCNFVQVKSKVHSPNELSVEIQEVACRQGISMQRNATIESIEWILGGPPRQYRYAPRGCFVLPSRETDEGQ